MIKVQHKKAAFLNNQLSVQDQVLSPVTAYNTFYLLLFMQNDTVLQETKQSTIIPRGLPMLHIYVDADACPVKKEVYRAAERKNLLVTLVSNTWLQTKQNPRIIFQLVPGDPDAADDWIAEQVEENDIVITADIPLANRSIKKGARVIQPNGRVIDEENAAQALGMRDLMDELRKSGETTKGPRPMTKQDRSRFLQQLNNTIEAVVREEGV